MNEWKSLMNILQAGIGFLGIGGHKFGGLDIKVSGVFITLR